MCQILDRIKDFIDYKGIPISAFEKSIGMSNASFGKQLKKGGAIGTDKLENILKAYPEISPLWLLTGKGEMLRSQTTDEANQSHDQHDHEDAPPSSTPNPLKHGVNPNRSFEHQINPPTEPNRIPLVSVQAVGGFAGKDFAIHKHDIEAYYVIPKFRNLNVDFLIEVVGDSMMPRIFPGDIVACSIIRNPQFIQWNKTYLISSEEQGMIVKRLKKSNEKDCYLAVSDNLEYDPFDIPKSDIRGIARVVGVIHAE